MQLATIRNRIYEVRGLNIMLDFDIAALYGIETKNLKQAVKRNIQRFPKDFMFQLNKKEWKELITNCDKLPEGVKYSPALPYAFTEHGVTMLASIIKSKKAIQMNIAIVRAFIALKTKIILIIFIIAFAGCRTSKDGCGGTKQNGPKYKYTKFKWY